MNRRLRRILRFGKPWSAGQSKSGAADTHHQVHAGGTPQDVPSVRAKSSGHGKVTADKWNQ